MCFNPGWNLKMARVPFLTEEVTCACLDGKDRPDAGLPQQLTTRLDGKGGRGQRYRTLATIPLLAAPGVSLLGLA